MSKQKRDPEQHRINQRKRSADYERRRKAAKEAERESTLKNRSWLTKPLVGN